VKLDIPEELIRAAELTTREARLLLAVQLFADRRLSHRQACELAGVMPVLFNRALVQRDISLVDFPPVQSWRTRRAG
jgi:predicted HTH domain antitoxin